MPNLASHTQSPQWYLFRVLPRTVTVFLQLIILSLPIDSGLSLYILPAVTVLATHPFTRIPLSVLPFSRNLVGSVLIYPRWGVAGSLLSASWPWHLAFDYRRSGLRFGCPAGGRRFGNGSWVRLRRHGAVLGMTCVFGRKRRGHRFYKLDQTRPKRCRCHRSPHKAPRPR